MDGLDSVTTSSTPSPDPVEDASQGESRLGAAGALTGVVLWAVGNVIIAGGPMTGLTLAFWRSWIAVAVYAIVLYGRGGRLHRKDLTHVWQGGIAYSLDIATFFVALTMTSLAIATTLSALQPIGILVVSALVLRQRATADQLLLTLVAVAGTITVVLGAGTTGQSSMWGNFWALAALFFWIWYFVGSKSARGHLDVLDYQLWISIIAGVILLPISLVVGDGVWGDIWPAGTKLADFWAAGVIVVVSGSGHLLMNWAHAHTKLIVTSVITLLGPPLGSILALVFLDQRLTWIQWVGIAITVAALAAFLWRDNQRPATAATA